MREDIVEINLDYLWHGLKESKCTENWKLSCQKETYLSNRTINNTQVT